MQSVTAYALDIQERSDPRFGITSGEVLRNCTRQLAAVCSLGRAPAADQAPLIKADCRARLAADLAGAPEDISQPHSVRLPHKKRIGWFARPTQWQSRCPIGFAGHPHGRTEPR